MINTYGMTPDNLMTGFWPHFRLTSTSKPNTSDVSIVLEQVAAGVNAVLESAGLPEANQADHPNSYLYLQETIGYGAAARTGRMITSADPILAQRYASAFESRMEKLRDRPEKVLKELTATAGGDSSSILSHADETGDLEYLFDYDSQT